MGQILDKILIIIVCSYMCMCNDVSAAKICAVLIAVIYTCINKVFDKRAVKAALNVAFITLCIWNDNCIFFTPVYLYDNIYYNNMAFICAVIMPLYLYKNNIIELIIISAFSVIMAFKTVCYIQKKKDFYDIQDRLSEVNDMMVQMKKDVIEKQDYEIHTAKLSERNRIAREIHDNVGHMLSRAILQTGALKAICRDDMLKQHIAMLHDTLNTAMNSIRESVHDLRDESFDLHQMIDDMINEYLDRIQIVMDYDMSDAVSKNIKFGFAAIVKEAVTNTVKHSNASRIEIVIREHPGFYQLLVEDNGTSVNYKHIDVNEGMGIDNMRERVHSLGGNIDISKEKGFRIFVTIFK